MNRLSLFLGGWLVTFWTLSHLQCQVPLFPALFPISLYLVYLYNPRMVWMVTAIFLGFLNDLMALSPIGLHSTQYMLFMLFVSSQRDHLMKGSFWMVWAGFGVSLILLQVMDAGYLWLSGSPQGMLVGYRLFETLLGILLYPLLSRGFMECYKLAYPQPIL